MHQSESNSPREEELKPGINILYIQMQFCDGETLEDFMQTNPLDTN